MKKLVGAVLSSFLIGAIAAPALAQEAPTATPSRGLTSVGYGSDFGIFVETPLPNPGQQVEFWSWMIRRDPKMVGASEYDMVASRELVDCIAWTRKRAASPINTASRSRSCLARC